MKKDRKSYIINVSKEYSIVSQFTSFVAIEEREKVSPSHQRLSHNYDMIAQDEKFDAKKGPSIEELVAKEGVDKLDYVGWMVDQGADPKQVREGGGREGGREIEREREIALRNSFMICILGCSGQSSSCPKESAHSL